MQGLPGHLACIAAAGFCAIGARWLGDAAWEAYYGPLAQRIAALRPGASDAMTAVLDDAQAKIDLWRAHGAEFGYYLTVVRPA
jgi:hypothetical protein